MDLQLKNHCILITGGTDGIGLALAKNLISEGANVAVCGRDEARLENARQLLGDNSLCFKADVTKKEDIEAFIGAFKNYATAAYQSYFARYTNQVLKVTGSAERSPTDVIVQTQLIEPGSSQAPAQVDFRVRTDAGKPVLVDVAYQGIWLSLEERDQFVAFLGQNNGNVRVLIKHLSELAVNLGKPSN